MKIVEVIWTDITYKEAGWHHFTDVEDFIRDKKENTVIQVGFVYKEDEEMLYLVDSYFRDERTYGTIHKIPRGCIEGITELKTA